MNAKLSDFSAAIFDLDGTLADSNTVWDKLDRMILEKYTLTADDELVSKLASMTYQQAADALRKLGIPITDEEFTKEINVLAKLEYENNIPLKPYASELLREMKALGMKLVLATGSPAELFEPLLRRHDVYSLFDGFITTDEVGKSKEQPDIYIKAAEIAGFPLSECVIFEDTLTAVRTASKTGAYVCAVYDKYSEQSIDEIKKLSNKFVYSFTNLL
ncbi:MAG: HAD family hydrolase [Oscillospiraceae bacterium]